jgi:hypothetical protein
LEYWYLLNALSHVQPRQPHSHILATIAAGLRQVDAITTRNLALQTLNYTAIQALITQGRVDRELLIQALLDFIGTHCPQLSSPLRILRLPQIPHPTLQAAVAQLQSALNPDLAQQLQTLLNMPKGADILVTRTQKPITAEQAIRRLLRQNDAWRPLFTLSALIALPAPLFAAFTDAELVNTILEKGRKSGLEALRQAARHIHTTLEAIALENMSPYQPISAIVPTKTERDPMLSTIERMLFLRNVSLFETLRLDQLRTLARICSEQAFNSGEHLIRKGEVGDSLFIVVEGEVDVIDSTPGGARLLATLHPGDVLGEISLFDRGVRSADAVAKQECLVLVVHRTALDDALADDPGIALDLLRVMAQRLRHSNLIVAELTQQQSTTTE